MTQTIKKQQEKQQKRFDDTIITWIKIYPYNLGYAFQRASEVLGCKKSKVSARYYQVVKHTGEVYFELRSDQVTLVNRRTIPVAEILKQLEDQV